MACFFFFIYLFFLFIFFSTVSQCYFPTGAKLRLLFVLSMNSWKERKDCASTNMPAGTTMLYKNEDDAYLYTPRNQPVCVCVCVFHWGGL